MIDSLQRTSSVPIAEHQTERSTRDPAPVNHPDRIAKDDDKRLKPSKDAQSDDFKNYLDKSGISHHQQNAKSSRFDPVAEIGKNSIYGDPGQNTPI